MKIVRLFHKYFISDTGVLDGDNWLFATTVSALELLDFFINHLLENQIPFEDDLDKASIPQDAFKTLKHVLLMRDYTDEETWEQQCIDAKNYTLERLGLDTPIVKIPNKEDDYYI